MPSWLGDIANWFKDVTGLASSSVSDAISDWFKSLSGQIASGFETAFTAIFKDLWDVMVGPLEILGGALIALMAFGLFFRYDVMGFMGPQ
jgi:hypothetical protein